MRNHPISRLGALLCLLMLPALAQAPAAPPPPSAVPPPLADPAFLERYGATNRFRLGRPTSFVPTPDGTEVLFLRSGPRSFVNDLYALDVASGEERVLLRASDLLGSTPESLSVEERARRERRRQTARGIASFELSQDGHRVLVPLSDRLFLLERATGKAREIPSQAGGSPLDPHLSPDGRSVACVRDGDVYVTELASGRERRLTAREAASVSYGLAEFVAQEEMDRFRGYWWSPDSRRLALTRVDTAGMPALTIANPLDPGQPAHTWPYPRAGTRNAEVRLGVLDLEGPEGAAPGDPPPITWVEWDRERYPYLATVHWKGGPLVLVVQNRAQTEELVLAAEPSAAGLALRTLLVERDEAWINLDPAFPHWLAGGERFLWSSERSGHWTLELRHTDGRLLRELAGRDIGYRGGLLAADGDGRQVWVRGGPEPTEIHVYRLDLERPRSAPRRLTREPGLHDGSFGRRPILWVHTWDGPQAHKVYTVRRPDGRRVTGIRSASEPPPFVPGVELTRAGEVEVEGAREPLRALLIRPRDFVPGRRYPVIVSVYGGPHAQTVTAASSGQLLNQWLADHGFVVVSVDGRGTPGRGRAWERAIRGDLIRIPLEDQSQGLEALGKAYPELDLGRVGIYGWSFGGYFAALAVMRRPDLYRAAVAGAPVTDWADYDTHYTERYMGLPEENPAGYRAASALTWAADLDAPLLLIHGTADDNVYFLHSLKLADALFRAGKEFEFLPLAGFTHMVPDPLVTTRLYTRIADFFVKHLDQLDRERPGG